MAHGKHHPFVLHKNPVSVRVRGKLWRVFFIDGALDPDGRRGDCDAPTTKGKKIRVRTNLEDVLILDTILHELGHAALWEIDEEVIAEIATDQARFLHKLGFRKLDPDELEEWESRRGMR